MDKSRVPHRQLPPNRTLGASLSSRDSRPSCPWLLRPKEHASPSSVNASEWKERDDRLNSRPPHAATRNDEPATARTASSDQQNAWRSHLAVQIDDGIPMAR